MGGKEAVVVLSEVAVDIVAVEDEARFRDLMQAHHYLGAVPGMGETVRYVAHHRGRWLALAVFSAPALKCGARDRWIGWDYGVQFGRLHLVTNNSRFLILPGGERNLGSRVLSLCARRLVNDWPARFGHDLLLAETFVDPAYFRGTVYRAANWIEVGRTRGFARDGHSYSEHAHPKLVFLHPLCRGARARLRAAHLDPRLRHGVPKMTLSAARMRSLPEFFQDIDDPRRRQGRRHALPTVLALATAATLCGMRGYKAISEWVDDLSPKVLQRFRVRRQAAVTAHVEYLAAVLIGIFRLRRHPIVEVGVHLGLRPGLVAVETAHLLDVSELALARRVVHDRNQLDQRVVDMGCKHVDDGRVGDLAPQVQLVVGLQDAVAGGLFNRRHGGVQDTPALARLVELADRDGVVDRRDARADDLSVVRQHRRQRHRPEQLRPRHEMLFHIVGVDLDQAGYQVVAVAVDGGGQSRRRPVDRGNVAVGDMDGTGGDLVPQDDARIGEDALARHAAARAAGIVNRRSAPPLRTCSSWKMPTIAAPRAFASRISAMTTSRLAASRAAVGSSSSMMG